MLLKDIPATLIEAFVDRRLVLFAGAGLSIASGVPTGRELAFQLQTELFKNRFLDVIPKPDDLLQLDLVAQRYQLAFGRQRLNELLLKTFQKDGLVPNQAHKLGVKLFQSIITTNYDRLLEDALRQEGRNPIVVVRDLQLPNTSIPDRTIIYKLHGDIGTPDRIVITQRDYARIPLTEGIRNELRSVFLTMNVLFIGYSLEDFDFLRQLEFRRSILGEQTPKSYAAMPGAGNDTLFVKQCDEDNIDLFSDTAEGFLKGLERAGQLHTVGLPKSSTARVTVSFSEAETRYRATVCEDFKWIDFKGIPVLGGYLRVPIDQLFVTLSAVPRETLEPAVSKATRAHTRPRRPKKRGPFKTVGKGKGIFDILKEEPKLVILGDPGSGKTTLLRFLGYHLSLPEPQPEKIGLGHPYLPLYIPLREYASFLKENPKGDINEFIEHFMKSHNLEEYVVIVRSALESGHSILLLDGLDEVGSEEERCQIATHVHQFSKSFPSCRVILTSRKVGYPKAPIKNGFAHFVVESLSEEDIRTFIDLWCKATGETDKEKQNLIEAIGNQRVRELAENPLLITILGRVFKAYRNLPERRAHLYAKCVEALLSTWDLVRELPPVFQDAREANRIMGPIAYWIHRDCHGEFVTRDQLLSKLAGVGNLPRNLDPSALLTQIEERSGLIREVGLNQYAFSHLTFQEYYVAREVISRGDCYDQLRRFFLEDRWQEVVTLTAGLLDEVGKQPVTEFLNSFIIKPSFPKKPRLLQTAKLSLLIACLKDKVEPSQHLCEYVQNTLLSFTERVGENYHHHIGYQRLEGLGKTSVGSSLLAELRARIKEARTPNTSANCIVLGYAICKDELDKASFLVFALSHVNPRMQICAGAAVELARILEAMTNPEARGDLLERIRALPFEHRRKILDGVARQTPPALVRQAVEVLTSPDERLALPKRLRVKP